MKSFEEGSIKLKKALTTAYHEKEKAEVGELWQKKVMSHIHGQKPIDLIAENFLFLDQFVWRFAAAACFVAVILSAYTLQADFSLEYEAAKLFLEDPVEYELLHSFGIK